MSIVTNWINKGDHQPLEQEVNRMGKGVACDGLGAIFSHSSRHEAAQDQVAGERWGNLDVIEAVLQQQGIDERPQRQMDRVYGFVQWRLAFELAQFRPSRTICNTKLLIRAL